MFKICKWPGIAYDVWHPKIVLLFMIKEAKCSLEPNTKAALNRIQMVTFQS
jgi:hypothetical protein